MLTFGNFRRFSRKNNIYVILIQCILLYSFYCESRRAQNTWVLIYQQDSNFEQTGLKKTSLIRADKIATVNKTVFVKKLGTLPIEIIPIVQLALKKALNLFED